MKEIVAYEDRLKNLFARAQTYSGDAEAQAHWARYLCILVAGYLETATRIVLSEYVRSRADTSTHNYVQRTLETGFRNPKTELLVQLVGKFDQGWQESLRSDMDGQLKDAVDSIVNNRHQIAHGRQVGLTLNRITGYYKDAQVVVGKLRVLCQ